MQNSSGEFKILNLGIMIWSAVAVICLFCAAIFANDSTKRLYFLFALSANFFGIFCWAAFHISGLYVYLRHIATGQK